MKNPASFSTQAVADGRSLVEADVLANVERIVAAADLPVSTDVENAYADDPDGVHATITEFLATGIVGINLEDSGAAEGPLHNTATSATQASIGCLTGSKGTPRSSGVAVADPIRVVIWFNHLTEWGSRPQRPRKRGSE
ncbi:isocitrate lyase/phosphoenolpyruvate mutase family protein [Rhodococcus sp. NPDC059234]|uniref:isocitrate lyase/phosphoenolpyruvate mutase family protein n=1 Tax=Rhodococcus sp. NPDC059234 TaxID=3346781 RepID=UPI00366BAAB9